MDATRTELDLQEQLRQREVDIDDLSTKLTSTISNLDVATSELNELRPTLAKTQEENAKMKEDLHDLRSDLAATQEQKEGKVKC